MERGHVVIHLVTSNIQWALHEKCNGYYWKKKGLIRKKLLLFIFVDL